MLMQYSVVNNKRGFSLLEMMIVVAMIAILSAVAVIAIKSNMPQYYLSGAARQVLTDLMLTRMKAVSENKEITVTFSSRAYTINGLTTDISQFKDVLLASNGSIKYTTMGTTYGGVTITLASPGLSSKQIIVSTAGGVRIK
jgi:type IV fimbrial biogenesis protein FimT